MRRARRVGGRRGPVARPEREPRAQVAPAAPAQQGTIEATPVDDKVAGAFVALQLPSPPAPAPTPDIRIELRRGATTINSRGRAQAAGECAAWLRELLR